MSSLGIDWNTPANLLERVRAFDAIGLDPCSNVNSIVDAAVEWCEGGLDRAWSGHGLVYCNPPYGRAIGAWVRKCNAEYFRDAEIIALVPARPDTLWWQQDACDVQSTCFWRGRLKFLGAPDPAPFPSALLYWGPRAHRFRDVFASVGVVMVRQ